MTLSPYIWDRERERKPPEAVASLQSERLVALIERVLATSSFHRRRLAEAGIAPGSVRGIEDLGRLPFTTKAEMRAAYPLGMLAVPRAEVLRVHASSGTTGKPTVMAYSRADLALWAELMARVLAGAGARPGVVVHNAYGYGLFTGGLGFQAGAERIGAMVVPASTARGPAQATLLADLGPSILACTPSVAITLAEAVRAAGAEPRALAVEAGIFGGEAWSEGLRARIERIWGLRAYDTYGLSEIIGPGVAQECEARQGLHVHEDHFIVEVIDPATGAPAPEGAPGELVFTALTREAMPMIRYRSGDHARLLRGPCPCGRTFARIGRVAGRADDVIAIGGRPVFASEVEDALLGVPGCGDHYQIEVGGGPSPLLRVEAAVGAEDAALARAVEAAVERALGVRLAVSIAPVGSLPRSEGKARRILRA